MTTTFKIDETIYCKEVIQQAINDFSDVSDISLSNGELTIQWENSEEINEVFNEFFNYTLSLINS